MPYDPRNQVLSGNALSELASIPSGVVQTCITSPPYWGLRDYKAEGQIGQEDAPEDYLASLVKVFTEVKRTLHDSGTLWINLGDTYRDKQLLGLPWRLALALQSEGWFLRSEVIWHKTHGLPEAVDDRPTRIHEHIFLLAKNPDYFYDALAVREYVAHDPEEGSVVLPMGETSDLSRHLRDVWLMSPGQYPKAHMAVFPSILPIRCIRASTSERGCCPVCRAPWSRIVESQSISSEGEGYDSKWAEEGEHSSGHRSTKRTKLARLKGGNPNNPFPPPRQVGWTIACKHKEAKSPIPCLVLDPFAGSGTTLAAATSEGRDYVGVELNPDYLPFIAERVEQASWERQSKVGFGALHDVE